MKYFVVNGSPHQGNTWKLTTALCERIKEISPDSVFEYAHLFDLDLPFCTGCSTCFRKGNEFCPHYGIMKDIIGKIDQSDGFIFSFTTFCMQPNALAKNLIDHLCFYMHRPKFFGKKALVVSTTGGVGSKNAVKYAAEALRAVGFNKCYELPVLAFSWNNYIVNEKTAKKLKNTAVKFHKDVASKKLHSPRFSVLMTYNLFRGMSLGYIKGTEYETEDGVFWTSPERIHCAYDSSVRIPVIKKLFGSLFYGIGKIASKFAIVTYKK